MMSIQKCCKITDWLQDDAQDRKAKKKKKNPLKFYKTVLNLYFVRDVKRQNSLRVMMYIIIRPFHYYLTFYRQHVSRMVC